MRIIVTFSGFQFYDSTIKRNTIMQGAFPASLFQFYDSTIKRKMSNCNLNEAKRFQFYDSTIKRRKRSIIRIKIWDFNSTIVQLRG